MIVNRKTAVLLVALAASPFSIVNADVVTDALADYRTQGAADFDAVAGARRWREEVPDRTGKRVLSCSSCHGDDLRQSGQHVRTLKPVQPMAPAVNSERLTDRAKIEKWFLRNCKGTWGRECTAQEKGDFLMYIQQQ